MFSVGASPAADNCIPAGGSGYDRNERSCVSGANIRRIADQSVPECAALCDAVDACVGFEYGVAYGGSSASYQPRECQLSSSANMAGCDGSHYNLDFYTPGSSTGVTDLSTIESPYEGSTVGNPDDHQLSCGGGGSEAGFSYSLPAGATIEIGQSANDYDSRHELSYGGAFPGDASVACVDDPDDSRMTWTNTGSDAVNVYFIVDAYSDGSGAFTLTWTITAPPQSGDPCAGGVEWTDSAALDGAHGDNADCTWALTCTDSTRVAQVSFSAFDMESNFDFVYVYDGGSTSAAALGEPLHGTSIPDPITATGADGLFLRVTSDGSVTGAGFTATLACITAGSGRRLLVAGRHPSRTKAFEAAGAKSAAPVTGQGSKQEEPELVPTSATSRRTMQDAPGPEQPADVLEAANLNGFSYNEKLKVSNPQGPRTLSIHLHITLNVLNVTTYQCALSSKDPNVHPRPTSGLHLRNPAGVRRE